MTMRRNSHKKMKMKVYKRDNWTCQLGIVMQCAGNMGLLYRAYLNGQITRRRALLTVDHKVSISKGGKWHPDNLQVACAPCNQAKGSLSTPAIEALLTDN